MSRAALLVGLGLIGGSIGLRLRQRGWHVTYIDPHVEEDQAVRAGAADARATSSDGGALIVLATPIDAAVEFLRNAVLEEGSLVTSTCGVMRPLRAIATSRFVAGHPMAGSEASGLAAARADLFEQKNWFVDREDEHVDALIEACGAQRQLVDAAAHDRGVALTSHLPQLLSTALAAVLEEHPEARQYAGSGLLTFLRLAGSEASVWEPLFAANRDAIEPLLSELADGARRVVAGEDVQAFERARRFWRELGDRSVTRTP